MTVSFDPERDGPEPAVENETSETMPRKPLRDHLGHKLQGDEAVMQVARGIYYGL